MLVWFAIHVVSPYFRGIFLLLRKSPNSNFTFTLYILNISLTGLSDLSTVHLLYRENQCHLVQPMQTKSTVGCSMHKPVYKQLITDQMSRIVRKPDFCLGENKGADQLRGNREADQRLCFRYTDSTISLLLKSEISSF